MSEKGKRWKKLHLGIDDQGQMLASTGTESREPDPSPVPALLRQIAREMGRCIGDGLYAQEPVSTAVAEHAAGARGIIPPRKDAGLSPTATTVPPQRDAHLVAIESEGRCGWTRRAGYDAQSHAENAFSRCKRTLGGT